MSKRYTITAALPYTNGPIHIGHLAGVYVPADIYSRYLRLTGNDVAFICGSDEHGVPITIKAKKEGVSPKGRQKAVRQALFPSIICARWKGREVAISFVFGYDSNPCHCRIARDCNVLCLRYSMLEKMLCLWFNGPAAKCAVIVMISSRCRRWRLFPLIIRFNGTCNNPLFCQLSWGN